MSGANLREYTASTAVTSDRTGEEDGAKADYRRSIFSPALSTGLRTVIHSIVHRTRQPLAGRHAASGSQASRRLVFKYGAYQCRRRPYWPQESALEARLA